MKKFKPREGWMIIKTLPNAKRKWCRDSKSGRRRRRKNGDKFFCRSKDKLRILRLWKAKCEMEGALDCDSCNCMLLGLGDSWRFSRISFALAVLVS
jgi:hypothetical protein